MEAWLAALASRPFMTGKNWIEKLEKLDSSM